MRAIARTVLADAANQSAAAAAAAANGGGLQPSLTGGRMRGPVSSALAEEASPASGQPGDEAATKPV